MCRIRRRVKGRMEGSTMGIITNKRIAHKRTEVNPKKYRCSQWNVIIIHSIKITNCLDITKSSYFNTILQ